MKKKIALYFVFVLLFALQKPLFMLYHWNIFSAYPLGEWLNVVLHGLPHDLTCAGYVMALPFILTIVNIWLPGQWHVFFMRWYLRLILLPIVLIFFVDLELYTHWGFRLDSTAFGFFLDSPLTALEYAPLWALIVFPVAIFAVWWLLQKLLTLFYAKDYVLTDNVPFLIHILQQTGVALLLCGLLFVAIRGGVTTSTMNVGRVYYSQEMPLNQAATNPLFSFFSSLGKKDLSKQYRFMSDEEAEEAMLELLRLGAKDGEAADASQSDRQLLNIDRPNILLVLLESFNASACTAVNPDADPRILPNVSRLYGEGIGFTNFFANSFRTDRGIVSILASYPGQPTYSVMKDQNKCNNMQHLSKRLNENGYSLQYIHGGDVDFTNQKGFLRSGNFIDIVRDTDFPITDRLSKRGVPDGIMFDYTLNLITSEETLSATQPYFKVLQTLSSHEPFDVPFHCLDDPYCNSAAYTDSCLGAFIDSLKVTPAWDNLLVMILPDHCYAKYPETMQNHELAHFRIPMVWTGGAIKSPRIISTIASQIDISATLLNQMGIDHDDFVFSKDIMDPMLPHFAFYSFSDGFGFVTDSCTYIQDNKRDGFALSDSDDPEGKAERWGKAYLQRLYDDLSER